MTPEEAKQYIRRLFGYRRTLTGDEYQKILTLIQLSSPVKEWNNQRTHSAEYKIGGKQYVITYGFEDAPEIEEINKSN
jgi:hypothetical protein